MVVFDLPEAKNKLRVRLRRFLQEQHFGYLQNSVWITPDPLEVSDVFEVPLVFLLDPAHQKRHFRMLGALRRDYWAIPYGDRYIWGATAAMLLILDRTLRDD